MSLDSLPANHFRNRRTWMLHMCARGPLFYAWILTFTILAFTYFAYWDVLQSHSSFIYGKIVFVELFMCLLPVMFIAKKYSALLKVRSFMAQEVIERKPSARFEDWDIVALHTNAYLHEKGLWPTAFCIFNGEECFEFFRRCLRPQNVSEVLDDEDSRRFQNAFRVYETSLEDYWNSDENFVALANDEYEQKLPRELYRCRFTWNLSTLRRNMSSWFMLIPFLVSLRLGTDALLGCLVGAAFSLPILFFVMDTIKRNTPSKVLQVLTFLRMKARLEPENEVEKWDDIARFMNNYLFRERVWQDREYFYDGNDCRERFKSILTSILSVQNLQKRLLPPELIPFAKLSNAGFERDGESLV
ncbi:LANO_0H06810g1_1 [Lachancea nothofagi CBS 11611]|uniref:LANO_0H06810g1_1 n=1 Tax=Lachancea nothofagi CBS 11611 TaxID=1266666 RepID=A0A1G4KLV3_9SACH|nr:LANO_0H06810g1_1 [Lachancea nothofagi CBS 11611]